MPVLISTDDVHPRDRLSYWNDAACKAFVEIECRSERGPAFRASIRSQPLADLSVSLVDTQDCSVLRSRQAIARSRSDDILLSLQLAGTALLHQVGRDAELRTGDFAVYDTQRPYRLDVAPGVRQLVLKLPRAAFERRLGPVARYAALTVSPGDGVGTFASGFIGLIPERLAALGALTPDAATSLRRCALDVIALALRHATYAPHAAMSSTRELALARLKAAIEDRLPDPGLRPASAAAAAAISVRYANELLAAEGQSLERYILARRLQHCARALSDPRHRQRTIGEIAFAWGLTDVSHFARRFKQHFGLSPRDWRAAAVPR